MSQKAVVAEVHSKPKHLSKRTIGVPQPLIVIESNGPVVMTGFFCALNESRRRVILGEFGNRLAAIICLAKRARQSKLTYKEVNLFAF